MMHMQVKVAVLLALFPLNLGAVLPELPMEMIRRALATVEQGGDKSLLPLYRSSYPPRTPASVTAIRLTTPYSRLLNRARARKNLYLHDKYTEDQAEREYRQEGPEYLEVIVTISCGWPPTVSSGNRGGLPYWDAVGSTPCNSEFSLDKYQITAIYKDDPGGNPTSHPYAGRGMKQTLFWSIGDEGRPVSVIGGGLRVALPLTSIAPHADLEVVISEPDGHTTKALFELSQLP